MVGRPFCVRGAPMDKLKNPDIAAVAAMVVALLVELAAYLSSDSSLLAQLPPQVAPAVLLVAAFARWRLTQPKSSPGDEVAP